MRKHLIYIWNAACLFLMLSVPGIRAIAQIPTDKPHWISNEGQFDDQIAFYAHSESVRIALMQDGSIRYATKTPSGWKHFSEGFIDAKSTHPTGREVEDLSLHFLKGLPGEHRTQVESFRSVEMGELWEGIHLTMHAGVEGVEKIFRVDAGRNVPDIRIRPDGVEEFCLNEEGELQLDLEAGSLYFTPPVAWQESNSGRQYVPVTYDIAQDGSSYGFTLGSFVPGSPVYIDPLLSSGFIGGSQWDFGQVVKVGKNGKVYVGGITESLDLANTNQAYDPVYNDSTDVFVARFDASLKQMEVLTFVGGQYADRLKDMVLDTSDKVYFTGETESEDYPVTPGAYDESYNDPPVPDVWGFSGDMMISCLSENLSELVYSTFLGNYRQDFGSSLDLDQEQNVFIVGDSYNGIPPVGPQFNTFTSGGWVMAKLDSTLSMLLATNSLVGNNYTAGMKIRIDSSNQVFVAGTSWATNLYTTPECLADTNSGKRDVFIMRLNNDLDTILASTYLGGFDDDFVFDLLCDTLNEPILCGNTKSKNFPVSEAAYNSEMAGTDPIFVPDAFIVRLDSQLQILHAGTFLGGTGEETAYGLAFDSLRNILVTGYTTSEDFPVYCYSWQQSRMGEHDAFISKLTPKLEKLLASTYIGGRHRDHSYSIDLNHGDTVYITGYTQSNDFPVILAYDGVYDGNPSDGFVLSIDPELDQPYPCCPEVLSPAPFSQDVDLDFTLEWAEAPLADGYFVSAGTRPDTFNLVYHFDMGNLKAYSFSGLSCGDTIYVRIQSYNHSGINENCLLAWYALRKPSYQSYQAEICEGDNYEWQGMDLNTPGNYTVSFTDSYGCDSILQLDLSVYPSYYRMESAEICANETYWWQGESYDQSGTFSKNFPTQEGCDSLFELELWVHPVYEFTESAFICEGESYSWEGFQLEIPGTYGQYYTSEFGCDSTLYLELFMYPSYEFSDTVSVCPGEQITWHDHVYDTAGDYEHTYPTMDGCDSTYLLHYVALPEYHFAEEASICQGDSMLWHGTWLDTAGQYQVSYLTQDDCDSSYTIDLTFIQPDTTVTQSGDTLSVPEDAESTYQWLSCPDMEPIEGATGAEFIAQTSGSYAVVVNKSECVDTSACYYLLHSQTNQINQGIAWRLYPNPTGEVDYFTIEFDQVQDYDLRLIHPSGKRVWEDKGTGQKLWVPLDGVPAGVYLLEGNINSYRVVERVLVIQ